MVSLTSSAATPFFYSAQLSAQTSGAQASLSGINPALGLSADALQQEADALFGGGPTRAAAPPAPPNGPDTPVQQASVQLGHAPANAAPAAPDAAPAAKPADPAAASTTPGGMTLKEQIAALAKDSQVTVVEPALTVPQDSAPAPGVSYYEARIHEMSKALSALASLPWPQNSVALILITGLPGEQPGSPAQQAAPVPPVPVPVPPPVTDPASAPVTPPITAADLSGDDSVEQRADVIRNIATGDGADALTLEGRIVRGIHTDRDMAQRPALKMDSPEAIEALAERLRRGGRGSQYANADSLSIRARHARNISTGGGDDAIAIQAGTLRGLRAGSGNDSIAVAATLVSRIKGGAGDDVISVAAQRALRTPNGHIPGHSQGAKSGNALTDQMRAALSGYAQVDGGSGNDQINLQVGETLAARGGTGDDRFSLNGGTVALQYGHGDGHDTVALENGANAVVQLREIGASAYSATRDGDSLTLTFDTGGSITFNNLAAGGAIGVAAGPGAPIALLHQPPALDATA